MHDANSAWKLPPPPEKAFASMIFWESEEGMIDQLALS